MFDMQEIDKIMQRTIDDGVKRKRVGPGRPSGTLVAKAPNSYTPPTISKPMMLQKMNERHHEIARLSVLGYDTTTIADKLGISKQTVYQAVHSPILKAKMALLRGHRDAKTLNLMDEINNILPDAITLLKNVIDGGTLDEGDVRDRALQVSTAKHLLGIGGLSPVKRVEARTQTTHLTADDIRGLVTEARELGMCVRNDEDVIDIESEELQTGT